VCEAKLSPIVVNAVLPTQWTLRTSTPLRSVHLE
jgi:hypothetical protein